MHFEILIEDQSGKKALDILMPKIIEKEHTYRVISYRGIGRIPKNLKSHTDARKRILLVIACLSCSKGTERHMPTTQPAIQQW